jgi:hypothetical protein
LYNGATVQCPLCGQRKARRGCPALGRTICSVCCATKRLTEIACPADCGYLSAAREHPSAATTRQRQHDLEVFLPVVRDLSDTQGELVVVIAAALQSYQPPELQPLLDHDVAEATDALAATFETAANGIIYEHRPSSISAERLTGTLRAALDDARQQGQRPESAFQRDAALVLRRLHAAVLQLGRDHPEQPRAFVELLTRVFAKEVGQPAPPSDPASRLVIP